MFGRGILLFSEIISGEKGIDHNKWIRLVFQVQRWPPPPSECVCLDKVKCRPAVSETRESYKIEIVVHLRLLLLLFFHLLAYLWRHTRYNSMVVVLGEDKHACLDAAAADFAGLHQQKVI